MQNPLRKIGKDTFIYLPSTITPAFVSLISIPIYTRIFAPSTFGNYLIATTTIALLTALFTGWLGQSSLRFYEVCLKENKLETFHSSIFFSMVFITFLGVPSVIAILFLSKSALPYELFILLLISIFCFWANGLNRVYMAVLRAAHQSKYYTMMEIITSFSRLSFALILILFFNFKIEGILIGFIIATLFTTFLMVQKLQLLKYIALKHFSWKYFKTIFQYGYPISIALISTWLLSLANRYLIGVICGSKEVGLYSVSSTLSEKPLTLLFSGIMLAAYPVIISVWEQRGQVETELLINKLIRYYLMIFTPVVLLISIFSKELILIISTEKYVDGHVIIPFIAVGLFFFGLSQYVAKGFELHKKTVKFALIMLSAGVLNILVGAVFVSAFGILGAGVSSMISYIYLFFMFKNTAKQYLKIELHRKVIFRIVFSGAFIGLYAFAVKSVVIFSYVNLALIAITSLILFALLLFLTGEINNREIQAIKSLFKTAISK